MIKDLLLFTLKLVILSKQSLALFHYDDVSYVSMIGQGSFDKTDWGTRNTEEVVAKALEDVDNADIWQKQNSLINLHIQT